MKTRLAIVLCAALLAAPALAQKVQLATTMGDIVIELDAATRRRRRSPTSCST